jgi:basic amino acid/polyamine antiporter, APA family
LALKRELSYFDLMNIVVGAIVGSDIYIAPGLAAMLVGPFSIVVWVAGGLAAMVLALVFAYSSYYVPNVGGSFAFVTAAFDEFYGFLAGWSMTIAEILSLPVFAITFTNYLQFFVPLSYPVQLVLRGAFLFGLTAVNIVGVKAAGKSNDILTLAKLTPLLLIIFVGLGSFILDPGLLGNYSPLAPLGVGNFGAAFILVFWAYAGFELGVLPAGEVKDPKRNIPRAVITGMAIVVVFYVLTNFVVYGEVNWADLVRTPTPLILVSTALVGTVGGVITSLGALASVSGTDETEILGTARLMYAMSVDGLLPRALSKVQKRFGTPYVALVFQGVVALALSVFSGLSQLISFAVFNLAFCFLLVCLALTVLKKKGERGLHGQSFLPWVGVAICFYLLYNTSISDKLVGSAAILVGIPVYLFFTPKQPNLELRRLFTSEESVLSRNLQKQNRFLANMVNLARRAYRRARKKGEG